MPVWFTVFLMLTTAWITPWLNQKFENQKVKSSYIIQNLDSLNTSTRDLMTNISILTNSINDGNAPDPQLMNKIKGSITELQWRVIEFGIIFDNQESLKVIKKYKIQIV